jgi:hypothetical protein
MQRDLGQDGYQRSCDKQGKRVEIFGRETAGPSQEMEYQGCKKDVEEIHDLTGVRMTLYFPDDVPEVTNVVIKLFDTVLNPIVRTANREDVRNVQEQAIEATTGKQGSGRESCKTAELQSDVDKQSNQKAPLPCEYTRGPWRSLSVNDVVHHWKHSGYRAVQLVLKLSEMTERDISTVISAVIKVKKDDKSTQSSEDNKLDRPSRRSCQLAE